MQRVETFATNRQTWSLHWKSSKSNESFGVLSNQLCYVVIEISTQIESVFGFRPITEFLFVEFIRRVLNMYLNITGTVESTCTSTPSWSHSFNRAYMELVERDVKIVTSGLQQLHSISLNIFPSSIIFAVPFWLCSNEINPP